MGRASSALRDRVIFVEGAPRSGTTWLVTLLATHPEIAGVDAESHLFDFGVDRLLDNLEGRDPYLHGLQSYLDRDELVDLIRDLCDGVLSAMRAHVSRGTTPPFVVEKTPLAGGGLDVARKREVYPDAFYVHIVRDREAVARSLMRAPWMPDRSYAACAGLWDRTVGGARAALGDLARYRELRYEDLRADPAEACRGLFEWLGVRADDEVLDLMRTLSRDPYSDLGAAPAARPRRSAARARALLERGVSRLRPGAGAREPAPPAFTFARALRERDAATLLSLTAPSLELVYRGGDGDRSLRGAEAREALAELAGEAFARRHVGEWWSATGAAPGEWWTSAPGQPLCTIFFSALGGDATRIDAAIALTLEGDLVRRAVIVSAGAFAGRPVLAPGGAARARSGVTSP